MGIKERKEREKQLRQQQILDAAKKVFLQKGLSSATIEDIAAQAELSPATFYLYFKKKDHLYASLNLMTLQYWFHQTEKIFNDKSLSVEEKMVGFKEAMYKTFEYDNLNLKTIFHIQLIDDTLSSLSNGLIIDLNYLARRIMNMMAAVYEEGANEGIFGKGHPMETADIMWSIFAGLVIWEGAKKNMDVNKDFLKPTLDRAFDIFLRGVKTK